MIDTATRTIVDSVNIGCQPSGVVVTPDGSTLYVASCLTDTVNVYDAATLAAGPEIPVGEFPEQRRHHAGWPLGLRHAITIPTTCR